MLGISPWVTLAIAVAAAIFAWILGRFGSPQAFELVGRAQAALNHRWAPAAFGVVTSAFIWYAWGGLNRVPVVHDEAAYVLQAEIFARNAWAAASPPLPEFFEQLYVLVTPVLASKYPPGHSLVLAPGALIGLIGLPVVILNGITGALIFALARRVSDAGVGLLTWLLYVSCFPAMYFRASYLSEVTSGAGWVTAFWCLLRWRETRARGWLLALAASLGGVAITRPLTAVALALPIAVVVLRDTWTRRGWRDLAIALGVGAAIIAIIPFWSLRTTHSPLVTPLTLYTRQYVPFDKPGFGADTTARPLRASPPDIALTNRAFYEEHRAHTLGALPRTLAQRASMIARDMWYEWRFALAPFALVGLLVLPAAAWVALAAFGAHVVLYLLYAHPPFWTVYYLESEPVLAFITALGVGRALRQAAGGLAAGGLAAGGAAAGSRRQAAGGAALLALAIVALVPTVKTLRLVGGQIDGDHAYFERFDTLVRGISDERAIVFVRYAPDHNDNLSLVRNVADAEHARVWIAHDRGADNARLLARAPGRRAFLFDESQWSLRPVVADGATRP